MFQQVWPIPDGNLQKVLLLTLREKEYEKKKQDNNPGHGYYEKLRVKMHRLGCAEGGSFAIRVQCQNFYIMITRAI